MWSRSARALALIAVSVAVTLAIVGAASSAGATTTASPALEHCVRVLLGAGRPLVTPVTGSASPQLASQFAIFRPDKITRRQPVGGDTLAPLAGLRRRHDI